MEWSGPANGATIFGSSFFTSTGSIGAGSTIGAIGLIGVIGFLVEGFGIPFGLLIGAKSTFLTVPLGFGATYLGKIQVLSI